MATLIVTPFTPREGSGRGLRTVGVVRALARTDDVEVAYAEFDGTNVAPALERDPRISLRRMHASRGVARAYVYARARLAGTPRAFARGVVPELIPRADDLARFDRVIADGPTAAAALLLVAHVPRVTYNAHNLEFRFRSQFPNAARDYGSGSALVDFERRILAGALETWLPTRCEVSAALELVPHARVKYVPNVVDVRAIAPVSPRQNAARVLFVADFSYEPNENAARLLVEEVMPRLWELVPNARLTLVGRSLQLATSADDRIEPLGFVQELAEVYASATCAVVPLLKGGGSPLKLVEAMAYGLPVVATGRAASSVDGAVDGTHYVEANDAGALAARLADVLSGAHLDVGRNGRQLVAARYSIESLVELVRDDDH